MQIRNGVNEENEVRYEGNVIGEGICIHLSENDPTALTQWLIRVFVQLPQGQVFLGGFTTNTALVDGAPSRIVGFASCPGAIGWMVKARNAFPSSNTTSNAELNVVTGKCCGGSFAAGVTVPPQPPGSGGGGGSGGFTPPAPIT